MNRQFIQDLQSSPYYGRIFDGHRVIMLFLSGSRLIDVVDERSDYDLVALTDETAREDRPDEFLTYDGLKVHWHYTPVTKFVSDEGGDEMSCFGESLFANIADEHIIYVNPDYKALCDCLVEHREIVGRIGAYGLFEYHRQLIGEVINSGTISDDQYSKRLYHIGYASYLLRREPCDKELLSKIKRIRWQSVSEQYKKMLIERFELLRDYVLRHPLNAEKAAEEIDYELQKILQNM